MLHTENNIKSLADYFTLLLKVFSMFKISVLYYDTIATKQLPEYVGIKYINCGKTIVCLLDNQTIEKFTTPFVKNRLFQIVGLYWIIRSNKNLRLNFQHHCPSWILNIPWSNTMICSKERGLLFEDYVTTARRD